VGQEMILTVNCPTIIRTVTNLGYFGGALQRFGDKTTTKRIVLGRPAHRGDHFGRNECALQTRKQPLTGNLANRSGLNNDFLIQPGRVEFHHE
jgi:hypothetical protein